MFFPSADDHPALIEATSGAVVTYRRLAAKRSQVADRLSGNRVLAAIYLDRSVPGLVAYAALLANRCPVLVLDPQLPPRLRARIEATYRPGIVLSADNGFALPAGGGPVRAAVPLHQDLALLLPTSGSTARSKLVRLSWRNLASNSTAICTSLAIRRDDVAVTALPLSYSYGLSVVHSHLVAGATLLVTDATATDERFWRVVTDGGATSCAGTPAGWRLMLGMGLERRDIPALRCLTSAGGSLPVEVHRRLVDYAQARGVSFQQMYGQTEASPRMTCMPADRARDKLGSVGVPLPGGYVTIRDDDGTDLPPGRRGSVWYRGPNVMMGYAAGAEDLALGDVQGNWLRTGDHGWLDNDGFLWIAGRDARFAKPYGIRVGLDDVDLLLEDLGEVASVAVCEVIHVYHTSPAFPVAAARERLAARTRLPHPAFVFHHIGRLPVTPSGKPDYRVLTNRAAGHAKI